MVVVDDDVGHPREIECDHKRPKRRTYPCGEKRKHGQHSGGEVTVRGERSESSRQIRPHDARKNKDEPEESKAVQCSDCSLGIVSIHGLEPGPNIDTEAQQPRDITQNEVNSEESFW